MRINVVRVYGVYQAPNLAIAFGPAEPRATRKVVVGERHTSAYLFITLVKQTPAAICVDSCIVYIKISLVPNKYR